MMKRIIFLIFLAFITPSAFTQISHGGNPHQWDKKDLVNVPYIEMASIDLKVLQAEDQINEQYKDQPVRFAYSHKVDLSIENSGIWETLENGDKIWRLGISSKGARSLNLTFSEFELPEGSELFVYNKENNYFIGSFTHENNKANKKFATSPVPGDEIIIEYHVAKDIKNLPLLRISSVAHDYKDIFKKAKVYNSSGSCNNNANCQNYADWVDQKNAVVMVILNSGTRWCSGVMLANAKGDDTPYFLSAGHCLDGAGWDVSTWVFHFNYENPNYTTCDGGDGSLGKSITGSTQRAFQEWDTGSDLLLLELSTAPPSAWNIFYAGWDRSPTQTSPSATCIHHPNGDIKKITFDTDSVKTYGDDPNFWTAVWNDGTTEGGSSGSPLFNSDKRVIGQLFGGWAACNNMLESDEFGKFDVSWDGATPADRLKDWLDPESTAGLVIDGYYPNSNDIAVSKKQLNQPSIKLYPNPTSGSFKLELQNMSSNKTTIAIYSILGELVEKSEYNTSKEVVISYNMTPQTEGLYLVEITSGNQRNLQKFTLIR